MDEKAEGNEELGESPNFVFKPEYKWIGLYKSQRVKLIVNYILSWIVFFI